MQTGTELRPGRTYILDDFTVVQVLAVMGGSVRYRVRSWSWIGPRKVAIRCVRTARLAPRIRAEVNGDFFPDVALPGMHRFERPMGEIADLEAHLADGATRWPFAGEA